MNLNQEKDLWQALLNDSDTDSQQLKCVELASLLLDNVLTEQQAQLASMDKDDLTDLMVEYGQAAQHTQQFLTHALPHIDPEYQGEAFEIQLKQQQVALVTLQEQLQQARQQYQQLQQLQQQQQTEIERLTPIKESVQQLQQINDELTQKINVLEEGEAFEIQLKQQQTTLATLQEELQLAEQQYQQLQQLQQQQQTEIERLTPIKESVQQLQQINDELTQQINVLESISCQLDSTQEDNQQQIDQALSAVLQAISQTATLFESCQAIYQQHFTANAEIQQAMLQQIDTQQLGEHSSELHTLHATLQQQLEQYDQSLGVIQQIQAEHLQSIKDRQHKH